MKFEAPVLLISAFVKKGKLADGSSIVFISSEFFRETFREKFYTSVEELQEDLDKWLPYYNYERPHRGYRNMGRRPIETIEAGKNVKEQLKKQAA